MPTELHRDDVRRMAEAGAQLADVLPREEFEAEHLPGTSGIPLKELAREATARLDRGRPVITCCRDYQ